MKYLFVCHYNVGRSQMAAALYNQLTHTTDATSAGTYVDKPGETLAERKARRSDEKSHLYTFEVMAKEGIDVSSSIRTQLSKDMPAKYDAVINMAEPENTPSWLPQDRHYQYWPVKDPGGISLEVTEEAKNIIKAKVIELIRTQQ